MWSLLGTWPPGGCFSSLWGQQWASQDTWLNMPGAQPGLLVLPSSPFLPCLPCLPFLLPSIPFSLFLSSHSLPFSPFLPLGSMIQFLCKPHLIPKNLASAELCLAHSRLIGTTERTSVTHESHFPSSSSNVRALTSQCPQLQTLWRALLDHQVLIF